MAMGNPHFHAALDMQEPADENGEGTSGVKPVATATTQPALRYQVTYVDQNDFNLGIIINADSRREYLGFFLDAGIASVKICPTLGIDAVGFTLTSFQGWLELRKSSHGPLVNEAWYSGIPGGIPPAVPPSGIGLNIIEIIPEG